MPYRGSWDSHEEELLRRGVQRHGIGSWERIRSDLDFKALKGRTGVQLKDKWRNLVKFQHVGRDEAGRAPVRAFRTGRKRLARTPKAAADGPSPAEPPTPRAPRAPVVRAPEPVNDFERARLENIRRNQEALAALMGGVDVASPKAEEVAAPPTRRRVRPAAADTPAIAELRDAKVVADANAESARVRVGETNAAVTAADAALGSGVGGEAAVDAAFAAKEDATQRLAEAERMAHAADAALVAAIAEEVEMGAEIRRAARVEAIKPSRSSARAASRPKKTYLEDDVFGEDEIRAAALGRVTEDRRFGIFDPRRYRSAAENNDFDGLPPEIDEEEQEHAEEDERESAEADNTAPAGSGRAPGKRVVVPTHLVPTSVRPSRVKAPAASTQHGGSSRAIRPALLVAVPTRHRLEPPPAWGRVAPRTAIGRSARLIDAKHPE